MCARATSAVLVAVTVTCLVLSGGCGPAEDDDAVTTPPPAESTSTPGTSSSLGEIELRLEPVASGFEQPVLVTNAGDGSGRLFVVEQGGRVRVVHGTRVAPRAFLDVSRSISAGGERGLLGLAFAPNYSETGRLYVNYTDRNGDTVVARFVAADPASDTPVLSGPEVLLRVEQPYANHNGGCVAFAPDGTLWVGMGDGGSAGDPQGRAQNPDELLGKMLSLDVAGSEGVPKPRVVMSGLRNPWRFCFDPENADVWIADVGQSAVEEVNLVPFGKSQGANLGWNLWEGSQPYPAGASRQRGSLIFPVIEYGRDIGGSITGGQVYRGAEYPAMDGVYLFGDFLSGMIGIARQDADGQVEHRIAMEDSGIAPASFGVDENGEILVCDYRGALLRVVPR